MDPAPTTAGAPWGTQTSFPGHLRGAPTDSQLTESPGGCSVTSPTLKVRKLKYAHLTHGAMGLESGRDRIHISLTPQIPSSGYPQSCYSLSDLIRNSVFLIDFYRILW